MSIGGGTQSGTPTETRGLARGAGNTFANVFRAPGGGAATLDQVLSSIATPLQRLSSQSAMGTLGFDPAAVGWEAAIGRGLADPASQTAGLFASLAPFEAQQQQLLNRNLAGLFGSAGGRFSGNIGAAGALGQSQLANEFMRTRQQGLLEAQGQGNQLLAALMPQLVGAQNSSMQGIQGILGQILGFGAPGAPVITEGFSIPGMIGTLGGAYLGGPGGAQAGAAIGRGLGGLFG